MDVVFSDRGRWVKAVGALALAGVLGVAFVRNPEAQGETFLTLSAKGPPDPPRSVRVGPEHLLVREVGSSVVRVEKFGRALEITIPDGPAGEDARRIARHLRPGGFVSVTAFHLGGPRFEAERLAINEHRWMKLAVSGAAAVAIGVLLPVLYRWSRGALRPRGSPESS